MRRSKWICLLYLALLGALPVFSCPRDSSASEGHAKESSQIPFELYNENLIVVKGTIGSIEHVNILLDTGTSPTAITREIAERLNLSGGAELLLSANGKIDVDSVILPRIEIGMLHLASARVVVQDLGFLQRRLGISIGAVAGLDLLRTGSFMIDYGKRTIVFAPAKAPKRWVQFEKQTPYLTVKAKINGQELRLLVDSATPGLILFRSRLGANLANLEALPKDQVASMFTATGAMRVAWFRSYRVVLGTESIGSQIILVADGDPDARYEFDGLLGLAKIGFQKIWFDFENGLFGWT